MVQNFPTFAGADFTPGIHKDGSYRPEWDTSFKATFKAIEAKRSGDFEVGKVTLGIGEDEATIELMSTEAAKLVSGDYKIGDEILFYTIGLKSQRTGNKYGSIKVLGTVDSITKG